MWWRRVPVRTIVKRTVLAAAAVQGATLFTLVAIDMYRKRGRSPAIFPRLPPRSVTSGSSEVTVYTYGEDLYRDMLHAIRHAKQEIFFETFIWKSDEVGQAFKTALIEAADRGVEVYVVFDEFANLVVPRVVLPAAAEHPRPSSPVDRQRLPLPPQQRPRPSQAAGGRP